MYMTPEDMERMARQTRHIRDWYVSKAEQAETALADAAREVEVREQELQVARRRAIWPPVLT
jgi:hypothetical protein